MTRAISITLLATLLGGCFWATTKSEGKKMRADIKAIDERTKTLEKSLDEKLTKLEEVLDKATKLLARNSADIGAEVEEISREQATITGLIMEAKRLVDDAVKDVAEIKADHEKRLADLEQRMVVVEQRLGGTGGGTQKTAAQLFTEGKAAYDSGDCATAQTALGLLVKNYPSDANAAEGQFMRAQCNFKDGDYQKAIGAFQYVFDKYAKSQWADDAIFMAGQAAEKLKWCTDARAYYGLLRQSFPKSPYAGKAATRDADLKKNARNKNKCIT